MESLKKIISLVVFITITTLSYSQYKVDLKKAPLNPIPEKYTKTHWGYKGDIKKMHLKDFMGEDTQEFNTSGYLVNEDNAITGKKIFNYDSSNRLISMTVTYKGGTSYTCNFKNENDKIVSRVYNDGSGTKFIYDSKGLWVESIDHKTNNLKEKFTYDNLGRIIKRETYNFNANTLSSTQDFKYQAIGNNLKVDKTTLYTSDNKTFNSTMYYDSNGVQITNTGKGSAVYDSKGNFYKKINDKGASYAQRTLYYYDGTITNKEATTESKPGSVQKPGQPKNNTVVTGCVYGDCNNGWGKKTYDGGSYTGFWENGKKKGYGVYVWTGNGKYIGAWDNDVMSGYGVYFSEDSKTQLSGNYENGKLNGLGKELKNGVFKRGIYSDGNLITAYDFFNNSGVTKGCTIGDCTNKFGKYVWDNGDYYIGFFENGNLKMGIYTFANGDKYEGGFNTQNQYDEMGRFFFKNGDYYGGFWKNGQYHGKGYLQGKTISDDKVGQWNNGSFVKSLK